jgi:VWFA-related protein
MRFGFMHLTLLLACGSLGIAAQTAPGPSSNATDNGPTFHATSRLVLVDVVVTGKRGEFIRDLKPADFTILENGKSVKISGFSVHTETTSNTPTQKLQLPPNVYTNFTAPQPGHPITIVLLDMLNTEYLERAYARQQMLKFLSSMPEGQPIALFVLGSKLRMLQGFTQSSDALVAAAKRILDKDENARLHTSEQEVSDASAMDAMLATYAGRSPASAVSIADALRDEQAAQTDVRIFSTLRSLQALGTMVAGYGGRKNLIWLSSDFPITFGPGFDLAFTAAPGGRHGANSNLYVDELHNTSSMLASSQVAVYPISVRGLTTEGPGASDMGAAAGIAQQTLARWGTETTMDDIARETGGEAFYNQNDLRRLMMRSLDEGTNYYTLAYVPQDPNWDARYRKIDIKVAVEGVKLRYRNGYYATPNKATNQNDAAHLLAAAMQPAVPESTSLLFEVQVLPPAADHKSVSIDFVLSPGNLSLLDSADQRKNAAIDFMAVALDKNLKESGIASNTVAAAMRPETYQQVLKTGFPGHLDLDLKPGKYLLRLGVIDRNSEKIGTLAVPLDIPAQVAQK